jgi:hypothetical protein
MTIDTQKLAADIKRMMELDAKRTQGDWHVEGDGVGHHCMKDGLVTIANVSGWLPKYRDEEIANRHIIAAAPLMADIIRQQGEVIRELREALHKLEKLVCEEDFDESCAAYALALAAPLVEKAGEL